MGAFDVALAQLVVNFMADAGAGVREMRRVVRPGGTVAACVWDDRGEMTLLRRFLGCRPRHRPRQRALDEGVRMGYSDPESLSALVDRPTFAVCRHHRVASFRAVHHFDELWNPFLAGVAPTGVYVATLDDAGQDALRDEFFQPAGQSDRLVRTLGQGLGSRRDAMTGAGTRRTATAPSSGWIGVVVGSPRGQPSKSSAGRT